MPFRLFVLFFLSAFSVYAQSGAELCASVKDDFHKKLRLREQNYIPGDPKIDITHYSLNLRINHNTRQISGFCKHSFNAIGDINTIFLDLHANHKVDSVVFESKKMVFSQAANKLNINFPSMLSKGKNYNVSIYYKGIPPVSGYGTFEIGRHGPQSTPVLWTLSEPFGASDWWPCKDDLQDKADSSLVSVTMDSLFYTVSNGLLVSEKKNTDGTKTFVWRNSYPIAHYLISLASTNYARYDFNVNLNGKVLPIQNYVYPEVLNPNTRAQIDLTKDMMIFFSNIFGEYPFIKERYGHAQCGFGGGMEHQTVSSMGGFSERLVAHEMAHQWFGDKITCKSWSDIFVNEAFAAYAEALWLEKKAGEAQYKNTMNLYFNTAKGANSPVFINNPSNINAIFSSSVTYSKGAVILHMLRKVVGDLNFFKSLKDYMASPLAYKWAGIDDFQKIVEKNYGKDLAYFFNQWTLQVGYPRYIYSWEQDQNQEVKVKINQNNLTGPKIFSMPVDLKLRFLNGKDSTVTVFHSKENEVFTLKNVGKQVEEIQLDPENWIMKEADFQGRTYTSSVLSTGPVLELTLYPNPSSDFLSVPDNFKTYKIFDTNGRKLLEGKIEDKKLNINKLSASTYYLQLSNPVEEKVFRFQVQP
jgi:aminopeptidase N